MKKLLTASFLGIIGLGFTSQATMAEDITVNLFSTRPEKVPYMVFINPLFEQDSPLTYNPLDIENKGGAFTLTYTNGDGKDDGFDGYPSASIGGILYRGKYYSNEEYSHITGMPIQIKHLDNNLRIKWETSQVNAGQLGDDDKWWATINVIFDSASDPNSRPIREDRDFDLVILRESNNNHGIKLKDRPYNEGNKINQVYWFFGREEDGSLKRFSVDRDGQRYDYAVRYKFFKYNDDQPPSKTHKNNKVHVKFFPLSRDADSILPNDQIMLFDHPLKAFIDGAKDYLQYVKEELTQEEIDLATEKLAVDNLWIKAISAGYEVYRTNPNQDLILKNEEFQVVLD